LKKKTSQNFFNVDNNWGVKMTPPVLLVLSPNLMKFRKYGQSTKIPEYTSEVHNDSSFLGKNKCISQFYHLDEWHFFRIFLVQISGNYEKYAHCIDVSTNKLTLWSLVFFLLIDKTSPYVIVRWFNPTSYLQSSLLLFYYFSNHLKC
jgi:hypothetical protein